jgi:biotin carboxyl carrier protein
VRYRVVVEGRLFDIEVGSAGRVSVNRRSLSVDLGCIDGLSLYSLLVDNRSYETHVEVKDDGECQVTVAGRPYRACLQGDLHAPTRTVHAHQATGPVEISAPLPGLLVEMRVEEGQRVGNGEVVAVLESMKMHLELRTPRLGVVRALHAAAGQEVAQGDVLAVIGGTHNEEKNGSDETGARSAL